MIIDTHLHVFPDNLAEKAITKLSKNSHLTPFTNGTISDTLSKMDKYNIDKAVCLNIAVKPNQDKKVNDFAIKNNSDRLIMFGSINPYSDNIENELKRLVDNGIKGIKLHPLYQGFKVDDPICDKLYSLCEKLGVRIAFHAGFDTAYPFKNNASPKRLRKVLLKYKNLKVQLAHLGGMMKWRAVYHNLCGLNCYFDLGMVAGYIKPKQALKIIDKHGIDKIMFATDCPWNNFEKTLNFLDSLGLSEENKEKILYKNALKFLDLE